MHHNQSAACPARKIITPRFVQNVVAYIEKHSAPLLIPPCDDPSRTLCAIESGDVYCLYDGHPQADFPPTLTWREFAEAQGYWALEEIVDYLQHYRYGTPTLVEISELFDEEADSEAVAEWWSQTSAPNVLAYDYLSALDLGPEFGLKPNEKGRIAFIDGYCPGIDTRMVEVADDLSLSLLQARLNELNEPTGIEVERY